MLNFLKSFLRCRAVVSSWLAEGRTRLRGVPGGPHQKITTSKIASQNSISDKSVNDIYPQVEKSATNNNFLIPN